MLCQEELRQFIQDMACSNFSEETIFNSICATFGMCCQFKEPFNYEKLKNEINQAQVHSGHLERRILLVIREEIGKAPDLPEETMNTLCESMEKVSDWSELERSATKTCYFKFLSPRQLRLDGNVDLVTNNFDICELDSDHFLINTLTPRANATFEAFRMRTLYLMEVDRKELICKLLDKQNFPRIVESVVKDGSCFGIFYLIYNKIRTTLGNTCNLQKCCFTDSTITFENTLELNISQLGNTTGFYCKSIRINGNEMHGLLWINNEEYRHSYMMTSIKLDEDRASITNQFEVDLFGKDRMLLPPPHIRLKIQTTSGVQTSNRELNEIKQKEVRSMIREERRKAHRVLEQRRCVASRCGLKFLSPQYLIDSGVGNSNIASFHYFNCLSGQLSKLRFKNDMRLFEANLNIYALNENYFLAVKVSSLIHAGDHRSRTIYLMEVDKEHLTCKALDSKSYSFNISSVVKDVNCCDKFCLFTRPNGVAYSAQKFYLEESEFKIDNNVVNIDLSQFGHTTRPYARSFQLNGDKMRGLVATTGLGKQRSLIMVNIKMNGGDEALVTKCFDIEMGKEEYRFFENFWEHHFDWYGHKLIFLANICFQPTEYFFAEIDMKTERLTQFHPNQPITLFSICDMIAHDGILLVCSVTNKTKQHITYRIPLNRPDKLKNIASTQLYKQSMFMEEKEHNEMCGLTVIDNEIKETSLFMLHIKFNDAKTSTRTVYKIEVPENVSVSLYCLEDWKCTWYDQKVIVVCQVYSSPYLLFEVDTENKTASCFELKLQLGYCFCNVQDAIVNNGVLTVCVVTNYTKQHDIFDRVRSKLQSNHQIGWPRTAYDDLNDRPKNCSYNPVYDQPKQMLQMIRDEMYKARSALKQRRCPSKQECNLAFFSPRYAIHVGQYQNRLLFYLTDLFLEQTRQLHLDGTLTLNGHTNLSIFVLDDNHFIVKALLVIMVDYYQPTKYLAVEIDLETKSYKFVELKLHIGLDHRCMSEIVEKDGILLVCSTAEKAKRHVNYRVPLSRPDKLKAITITQFRKQSMFMDKKQRNTVMKKLPATLSF
ncbi:hypothetical protein M3Y97_00950800 [Aphelenchoides bicaudatus]|nr:hypothetical protein M3Y97_00950800 [Aphelenchoides bicaudatus]